MNLYPSLSNDVISTNKNTVITLTPLGTFLYLLIIYTHTHTTYFTYKIMHHSHPTQYTIIYHIILINHTTWHTTSSTHMKQPHPSMATQRKPWGSESIPDLPFTSIPFPTPHPDHQLVRKAAAASGHWEAGAVQAGPSTCEKRRWPHASLRLESASQNGPEGNWRELWKPGGQSTITVYY